MLSHQEYFKPIQSFSLFQGMVFKIYSFLLKYFEFKVTFIAFQTILVKCIVKIHSCDG